MDCLPWNERRPSIAHMRVFGCMAYVMVFDDYKKKLNAKGTKCLFFGYCKGTKAYKLMYVESKKIMKN